MYTIKSFNTGQITLPKKWRSKYPTKHYIAEETEEGLLIKPLLYESSKDEVIYYENKE
ncbi:MAG: AbrB/MazE/SpoVT family DNA-binding domain-containing protein [bacterium]|nr:AbrB/MazE/SpoVT family DNA-binding domain-containing protein [bacterium]